MGLTQLLVCIIVFLFNSDVLSAPVLTSNVTSPSLISSTYVSLHCDAGNQNVTTYTFYRDGKNICSEPNVTCRDSYLHFQPITGSDNGRYTCTIQNPISSNTSNTLYLNVSSPVSDVILTSNVSRLVWPGIDSVSLTCSARGTNVSYSWILQGAPLPSDPRYHLTENNRVCTINPVSDKDNGTFKCTASNWINNETSNGVIFNLAAAVTSVTVTSNASGLVWAGQESVSLHCSALGTGVFFFWSLNGEPLLQDTHYHITRGYSPPHSNLTISPIYRSDTGPFTCTASNALSSETSRGLNLSLAWSPEGHIACLAESSSQYMQLTCFWPGGQPDATVIMVFNGITETGPNQVTRSVLINNSIQESTMMCYGDYLGRPSSCKVKFEIPQSPGYNNSTRTSVKDGQAAVMTVDLVSGLNTVFNWYRFTPKLIPIQNKGQFIVISGSSISTLMITDVTAEDAGEYECRAKNIVGSQSFLFTVDVTAPSSCYGLGGGEVTGIVIGVVAGIAIIAVIVFFVLKRNKKTPSGTIYENSNDPPAHNYSTTIPGNEMKNVQQEPYYEQLTQKNSSI